MFRLLVKLKSPKRIPFQKLNTNSFCTDEFNNFIVYIYYTTQKTCA